MLKIKLTTTQDVREFVEITNSYDSDVNIKSGRFVLDGKSILGIFSLDLSKPIEVELMSDYVYDLDKFYQDISKFEVK